MHRLVPITLATLLAFGLGCTGAVNGLGKLAGVDLEVQMGASAVHPSDFPASAPAAGEKTMSMRLTAERASLDLPEGISPDLSASHYRMEMVAYTVAPDQVVGSFERAASEVRAAGFTEKELETSNDLDHAALFEQGDVVFLVVGNQDPEGSTFTLIRLTPVADPSASP